MNGFTACIVRAAQPDVYIMENIWHIIVCVENPTDGNTGTVTRRIPAGAGQLSGFDIFSSCLGIVRDIPEHYNDIVSNEMNQCVL